MRTSLFFLPAVAAVCHGAALPVNPREPQGLGLATRSDLAPGGVTLTGGLIPVETEVPDLTGREAEPKPQELGSPTRTVLLPTPPHITWWPHPHPHPHSHTTAIPPPPTSRVTFTNPVITRSVPLLTVPIEKREPQDLGSPTRTVLLPTPPHWTHTRHPHPPPPPESHSLVTLPTPPSVPSIPANPTRTVPALTVPTLDARDPQDLGVPTISFAWPPGIPRPTQWTSGILPVITRGSLP